MRTEFGFARTSCACDWCRSWCERMPGYLIPSDLERLIPAGADPYLWAADNLRASDGAIVSIGHQKVRVPSLTPADVDGRCVNLQDDGRCAVHDNAPFGCAFFDCSDSPERTLNGPLSRAGIDALMADWRVEGGTLYTRIWAFLAYRNLVSVDVVEAWREQLKGK